MAATSQAQQDLVPSGGYGVVVMLNSFTPWREHAYAISSGIIDITEGAQPDVGAPVATYIDLGLLLVILGVVALGVSGVRRAPRWAARHADAARWWTVLRLLPHLLVPTLAFFLVVIGPQLQDNSLTSADIIRLAPSAVVLLLIIGTIELVIVVARVVAVRRSTTKAMG